MKLHFLLLHHLVQVQLLYILISSQTFASLRKPRVVHWPFTNLMQRTCKRSTALIVLTNTASWKRTFVEVMHQMSNMQVKAIVLSLVTVVWKPELNATMELQITAEDTCNSPTIFTHFHRKKILDGKYGAFPQSQWSWCRTGVKSASSWSGHMLCAVRESSLDKDWLQNSWRQSVCRHNVLY